MQEKLITVVTPTYNRAYKLSDCYNSLLGQTNKSFVWMIIDDGSTDKTEELVNTWTQEKKIQIKYLKKVNGGKASALNLAFEHIKTEYWVCLDSDDIFVKNTIAIALKELSKIKKKDNICGILALRNNPDGTVMGGKRIPSDVTVTTTLELRNKYKIKSEYIEFYKSDITKKYRYPEIPGEKFISSGYYSQIINEEYYYKVSQANLCICEYLDDGLTQNKNKVIAKNPKGYTLIMLNGMKNSQSIYNKSLWCLKYISGSFLSGYNIKKIINDSYRPKLTFLLLPFGWILKHMRFK